VALFSPDIFYVHFPTLWRIYSLNCLRKPTLRLVVFTNIILIASILLICVNIFFRILDEIFFRGYRKTDLNKAIFLIANPRSGTTLLLNILSCHSKKIKTLKLYHTLFPSVTFIKMVSIVSRIDKLLGSPLTSLFKLISSKGFKGWEGIHPIGLNKNEEDEGIWFLSFLTPAVVLFTPYASEFSYLNVLDKLDKPTISKSMKFYMSSLQRIYYALGNEGVFLIKSVMSSGRIHSIRQNFPQAQFIHVKRSIHKTLPSYTSMFSKTWNLISSEIEPKEYKALGQTAIDFFNHTSKYINNTNAHIVDYEDLINDPLSTAIRLLDDLKIQIEKEDIQNLKQEIKQAAKFKSRNKYSLNAFGWMEDEIEALIKD